VKWGKLQYVSKAPADGLTCMISSNIFVKLEELTTGKEAEGPEQ
jgi:hypothetical protein